MEILIVEAIDPSLSKMGGGEIYTKNLIEYLTKNGIKVTLLGVDYSRKPITNDKLTFLPVAHKTSLTGYEYFLRLMVKTPLMRIPVSTVIHAQRPEYMLPFILFHRRNPKIITLHGSILKGIRLKRIKIVRLVYKAVESLVLKYCNLIIAVDESTKGFYQQHYTQLAEKIKVIPVGIDLSKFRLLDRDELRQKYGFKTHDKIVVYVGRLAKEKNLDFLLNCFALIEDSCPPAKLVIVGDGIEREKLELLAQSLKLKSVKFIGVLEPDNIPEILNCADVLALCSLFEGSPTIVKEALACGVPVVSTDVGDIRKILNRESIGRIAEKNKDDFSHALLDMLLKKDREKTRIECAKTATDFSFEKVGEQIVGLYKGLLAEQKIQ